MKCLTINFDSCVIDNSHDLGSAHPLPAEVYHNPSIFRYKGKLLMAYRIDRRWFTGIGICELDEKYSPKNDTKLDFNDGVSHEDPRLFIYKEELYCSYTKLRCRHNCFQGQGLCRLDDKYKVIKTWNIDYGENKSCSPTNIYALIKNHVTRFLLKDFTVREKNWVFFQNGDKLSAIYKPHEIIEIDLKTSKGKLISRANVGWEYGEIRGGAPPVFHNGEYYNFFHSSYMENDICIFAAGCYTFKDAEITKISSSNILDLPAENAEGRKLKVVFPCGAIFENGNWIIAYGENNIACKIAIISEEELSCKLVEWRGCSLGMIRSPLSDGELRK